MADIHNKTEEVPAREEIQKRAYELYLRTGEEFSAQEYWLLAEEELRQEQAKRRESIPPKGKAGESRCREQVKQV